MVGDDARGVEVLLDQRRRHRQRFPGVVEARLVCGIDGKLLGRPDVDARQIADGVVVLGVTQPAREHDARVVWMALRVLCPGPFNPVDDRLPLDWRRLLPGLAGRHLPGLEPRHHEIPVALVADDRILRRVRRQVEAGCRLVAAVAPVAVGLEERFDARRERIALRRRGDAAGAGLARRGADAQRAERDQPAGDDDQLLLIHGPLRILPLARASGKETAGVAPGA